MRTITTLVLFFATFALCGKAYYAPKREMIQKSTAIVLVRIKSIKKISKKINNWTYREKAIAIVTRGIKGNINKEIEIYGKENFICAQTHFQTGNFLLFLKKKNNLWVGANWGLGVRRITANKVIWFKKNSNRFEMESVPIQNAIADIITVMNEQNRFAQNMVWRYMSNENTELCIPISAKIKNKDYEQIAIHNGFRTLKKLSIQDRKLTNAIFKQFYKAPIEVLNLNGSDFLSKDLIALFNQLTKVKEINLGSSNFSDEALIQMKSKNLETLITYNTNITDAGLAYIKNLPQLKHLNLSGKNFTDKGYKYLQYLNKLNYLSLSQHGVTDKTIEYLQNLPLKKLSIYRGAISDKAFKILATISSLESLRLPRCCNIDDEGIKMLTKLKKLKCIGLSSTPISDKCMKYINRIKSLDTIHLYGTNITDTGLEKLNKLPQLRYIQLKNTKITKQGIQKFKHKFPRVSISHNLR
jgi:uncharacterized protein YjbI with pentapeptide repeats